MAENKWVTGVMIPISLSGIITLLITGRGLVGARVVVCIIFGGHVSFRGVWLMKASSNVERRRLGDEYHETFHLCTLTSTTLSKKTWCKLCGLPPTYKPLIAITSFKFIWVCLKTDPKKILPSFLL